MAIYVFDKTLGYCVDKETREPMNSGPWKPTTPKVFGDYHGYNSPITGEWIEGRRARKYDMERHNCVDANELGDEKGKLRNEEFAKKHGLEHRLDG